MSAPIPLAEADVLGVRLHFELPRALVLSSNDRKHWRVNADAIANLRAMGTLTAASVERMDRAHLTVRIGWPDRRRRDAPNIWPTLKPLIDGITDAGLLEDDDDTHLVGPDLRPYHLGKSGIVVLDFEFRQIPESVVNMVAGTVDQPAETARIAGEKSDADQRELTGISRSSGTSREGIEMHSTQDHGHPLDAAEVTA